MVQSHGKVASKNSKRRDPRIVAAVIEKMEERVLFNAFTPGDLVVYRVGTGTGALGSASTAVFLDEYSPNGTLVQSIAMPTTAGGGYNPLTASGSATSEGNLTLSQNGENLVLTGYDATTGVAGIASTLSTGTLTTGTVTASPNGALAILTIATTNGMINGQQVTISGVGNVPNGTYFLSVNSSTKINLYTNAGLTTGQAASGTFTTGGTGDSGITNSPREVGIVSAAGTVNTTTTSWASLSGNNIRSGERRWNQ